MRITGLLKIVCLLAVAAGFAVPAARAQESFTGDDMSFTNTSFYLVKAREFYQQAQAKYEAGEYDESTEYANKARDFAEQYRQAVRLSTLYHLAQRRIKEARELIDVARALKATAADLQPPVDKLNEALSQFDSRNFELSVNSAEEAIYLAKDLINRLKNSASGAMIGSEGWKSYTVKLIPERRDCLWRISEYDFIYKDPWKWPLIWKANKDQIQDPDLIFPGQVFKIPPVTEWSPNAK
jgi:nucleoid-associated protein YgaU